MWDAQVTDTRGQPATLCIEGGAVTVSECHFADFDCDCDVDVEDVMAVADRWGCGVGMSCYDPTYDLDADGDIDIADVMRVVPYWGWSCASSASFRPLAGTSRATEATLSLDPAERTVEAGQTLTVQVVLDGAGNAGGFEFELGYDPDVVRVAHVALGDFLGTTGRDVHPLGPAINAEAGRLRLGGFSLGDEPGATGPGILAQVTYVAERDGDPGLALYEAQVMTVGGGPQSVALP
jgi:hypothetical protein